MPRPSKGAYLYLKKDRDRPTVWVIREGRRTTRTGCREEDRQGAEEAFGRYLLERHDPRPVGACRPDQMTIATAMDIYLQEHGPEVVDLARLSYAADRILDWWGAMTVAQVRGETGRRYQREREAAGAKPGTIHVEMSCLSAALNHCVREGYLSAAPKVTLPRKPPPKEDWWTRREAARVLRAARSSILLDKDGDVIPASRAQKQPRRRAHLCLFVLIGLYTGTRPGAILKLQWQPNFEGGWVDLANRVMYRGATGRAETNKRQPAIRIPPRLYRFLVYARRRTTQYVIEYDGAPVKKLRNSWRKACAIAGVRGTPHTLRHTCATWLMQRGVDVYIAAGFLGMNVATLIKVYAKQHPDYQDGAVNAFNRSKEAT